MPAAPVLSGVKTAAAVVSLSFSRQLIITPNCLWLPGVASSADIDRKSTRLNSSH